MWVLDFLIYYTTALYVKKSRGNLFFSSPIKRGVFNVALSLMLWFFALIMLLVFLTLKINLVFIPYIKIMLPLFGCLIYQVLIYVYIKRGRYDLITSASYDSFEWGEKAGAAISFLSCVGGIIAILAVEVLMEVLRH